VIVASVIAIVAAGAVIVGGADAMERTAVEDILTELNPEGNPPPEQRAEVEDLVETRLATGPFAVLGGGLAGLLGGVLLLSWARREAGRSPDLPAAPTEPDA
jgi:hypothetical protein